MTKKQKLELTWISKEHRPKQEHFLESSTLLAPSLNLQAGQCKR